MDDNSIQVGMFDQSNADLPLFSGTPLKGEGESPAFVPSAPAPATRQTALFGEKVPPPAGPAAESA